MAVLGGDRKALWKPSGSKHEFGRALKTNPWACLNTTSGVAEIMTTRGEATGTDCISVIKGGTPIYIRNPEGSLGKTMPKD